MRVLDTLGRWRGFCLAVACLFLCRGIFYLSVFPLFDGWDEYQHVARIDFEAQHGERPRLREETVREGLLRRLVRYPQGGGHAQLARFGAVDYDEFWERAPSYRPSATGPPLYEDQQAPLYYWLGAPLYRVAGGATALLRSVTILRLCNVLLGALAVYVVMRTIGRLVRPGSRPHLCGLVATLSPLYLQNFARVANDALAVLLGTLVVSLTLVPSDRSSRGRALLIGVLLGASTLAKTTNLILVPFAALTIFLQVRRGGGARRGLEAVGLLIAGFLLLTVREFVFHLQSHGTFTGLSFELQNHRAGRGLAALVAAIPEVDWLWIFHGRCLKGSLWQGGWSFVALPEVLRYVYRWVLALGIAGWVFLAWKPYRRRMIFQDRLSAAHVTVLGLCALAGIAYFALQSHVAGQGGPPNAWYVIGYAPWLTCLFCQGARLLPGRWPASAVPLALLTLYVGTEIYGSLLVLVPHYTGHAGWSTTWQRLSSLQVAALGPLSAVLALGAYGLLLTLLATVALRRATR